MQTVNQQIETELNQPVDDGGTWEDSCPSCGAVSEEVLVAPCFGVMVFHSAPVRGPGDLYKCRSCGCLNGMAYRGDVGHFVNLNTLVEQGDADAQAFDIRVLGSDGETRVHGFFRTDTKEVVQFG